MTSSESSKIPLESQNGERPVGPEPQSGEMTSSESERPVGPEPQSGEQVEDPYEMYDIPYTIDEESEEKYYNTIFQDVKDDNEPTKEEIEEMCKEYDEFVREEYEDGNV